MAKAMEVLQAQYDEQTAKWYIMVKKQKGSGPWAIYGLGNGYFSRELAERFIDKLVNSFPDYVKG
jgi:hypothetical protein